ncbi:MAG: group I intron-associated PD-(D/E)XK endonuclease, partial [Deltaproteobacteria bacterium]|nr:group I intron-associated PD-(D/E)XK endonuclease [Deltaproteobacteria bacterium]
TSWADKNGSHGRHYTQSDFDYYAVYCLEKDIVVYIPNTPDTPNFIRFDKTANNQNKRVRWANTYLDFPRESSETIRHTPETVKT